MEAGSGGFDAQLECTHEAEHWRPLSRSYYQLLESDTDNPSTADRGRWTSSNE